MPVVLLTGCSSGFGVVMATAFAEQGYQVVATMRNPDSAPECLRTLAAEKPADFILAQLDITNDRQRREVLDLAIRRFGQLDVLVNNAGITARGSVEDTPEDLWRRIFETNLFGPIELARAALPVMRQQGGGRIINVTSVAAVLKTPFVSAYAASKHALDTVSVALDTETRSFGVRVTCVMPGPFKTSLPQNSLDREPSEPYSGIYRNFCEKFDAMEAHAPSDLSPVVDAVLAAASDATPALRYLAGADAIPILPPILQALAPLQHIGLHLTGQS